VSFDLVETQNNLAGLRGVTTPEPGAWDNFLSGTARFTMKGFAEAGRAGSLAVGGALAGVEKLGAGHPLAMENDTRLSDAWFKIHEDVFQRAVDRWTPKPGEVGVAAEIAGTLLSTLPMVIASPAATVASAQLSSAESLALKGVDSGKAQAVGAVQAAGLGLGVWMPILGQNLWQRAIVGGMGFNASQGAVTRGIAGSILEGTPAAGDFKAFDWTAVTLDALLGLAFGGISHLSPAQRAQGEKAWERIQSWVGKASPSELDALVALRQAEHLNVETAPGTPRDLQDIDAHVQRARTALEQLANDEPVNVTQLPEPRIDADPVRIEVEKANLKGLQDDAATVVKDLGVAPPDQAISIEPRAEVPNLLPEAAGVDPLQAEATRFVMENPEVALTVGRNPDGTPIVKTAKDFLAESDAVIAEAQADAKLFEVAAACMLGAA